MSSIAVYARQQEGPKTAFLVAPAHYPKFWALIAVGGAALLIAVSAASVLALIIAGAGLWFGLTDPRPARHKGTCSFRVSPAAIEYDGGTFRKEDIERLTIETGYTAEDPIGRVALMIAEYHKAQVEQVTHALVLRSAGRDHTLAGGLDPKTAASLLAEVKDVLATSEQPSMAAGDFLLSETEFGAYQLERMTSSGREVVMAVPFKDDFAASVRFGLAQAGDATLWLLKIADRDGKPVVIPRSILDSPGFNEPLRY